MDSIAGRVASRSDDGIDVEVGRNATTRQSSHHIASLDVQTCRVDTRVDSHRLPTAGVYGTADAYGDLAAIGDQYPMQ